MILDNRDFDYTLMDVQRYGGGISSLFMTSTTMSMKLMVFLLRMAKKGLMSLKYANDYQKFLEKTGGNFSVYNIPLSKEHTERLKDNMDKMADLEDSLKETKNPRKKAGLRKQIEAVKADMPEFAQLEKLGIDFCALPKVNGLDNTVQVAIDHKDNPLFKNWFINHLSGELSGGEKTFNEIKAMTEGNTSIFNIPVEGDGVQNMCHDLDILGVNYAVLPDLKVGDGCTQIGVANTDVNTLKAWFRMFRQKQFLEGNELPEMYPISEGSYTETAHTDPQEYMNNSEEKYQQANAEYASQSQEIVQQPTIQKMDSSEYIRLSQDDNYTKITMDKETLINHGNSAVLEKINSMGYFGARMPGTYKDREKDIMLPKDQVFEFNDGRTYAGFIPKAGQTKVYNCTTGQIESWNHSQIMSVYDKITNKLNRVKKIVEETPVPQQVPGQNLTTETEKSLVLGQREPGNTRNRFKNFTEREYDMDLLQKLIYKKHLSENNMLKVPVAPIHPKGPK